MFYLSAFPRVLASSPIWGKNVSDHGLYLRNKPKIVHLLRDDIKCRLFMSAAAKCELCCDPPFHMLEREFYTKAVIDFLVA